MAVENRREMGSGGVYLKAKGGFKNYAVCDPERLKKVLPNNQTYIDLDLLHAEAVQMGSLEEKKIETKKPYGGILIHSPDVYEYAKGECVPFKDLYEMFGNAPGTTLWYPGKVPSSVPTEGMNPRTIMIMFIHEPAWKCLGFPMEAPKEATSLPQTATSPPSWCQQPQSAAFGAFGRTQGMPPSMPFPAYGSAPLSPVTGGFPPLGAYGGTSCAAIDRYYRDGCQMPSQELAFRLPPTSPMCDGRSRADGWMLEDAMARGRQEETNRRLREEETNRRLREEETNRRLREEEMNRRLREEEAQWAMQRALVREEAIVDEMRAAKRLDDPFAGLVEFAWDEACRREERELAENRCARVLAARNEVYRREQAKQQQYKQMAFLSWARYQAGRREEEIMVWRQRGEEDRREREFLGYATVVEILSAALQQGAYLKGLLGFEDGKKVPYRLGHFFQAIDVEAFCDLDDFKREHGTDRKVGVAS